MKNSNLFFPVVSYPKNEVRELEGIISGYENSSNKKIYDSIENIFSDMGIDLQNV